MVADQREMVRPVPISNTVVNRLIGLGCTIEKMGSSESWQPLIFWKVFKYNCK